MLIDYDPAKNARNIAERGLSFNEVSYLNWHTAIYKIDDRKDYGEQRIRAIVNDAAGIAHHVTFTMRNNGTVIRVISFRLARKNERKRYEQKT